MTDTQETGRPLAQVPSGPEPCFANAYAITYRLLGERDRARATAEAVAATYPGSEDREPSEWLPDLATDAVTASLLAADAPLRVVAALRQVSSGDLDAGAARRDEPASTGEPEDTDETGEPEDTDETGEPEDTDETGEPEDTDETGEPEDTDETGEPEDTDETGEPEDTDETGEPEDTDETGEPEDTDEPAPRTPTIQASIDSPPMRTACRTSLPTTPRWPSSAGSSAAVSPPWTGALARQPHSATSPATTPPVWRPSWRPTSPPPRPWQHRWRHRRAPPGGISATRSCEGSPPW